MKRNKRIPINKENRIKRSLSGKIVFAVVFIIFVLYAICLIFPFLFAINASLIKDGRTFMADMTAIAVNPFFINYKKAIVDLGVGNISFFMMFVNSLIFAGGSTFLGIMSSTFLAYAVSKYDFKLKKFLYALALFVMIIPIYGSLPAQYRFLKQINFVNSWAYLISTASGFNFNFLIIYAFFSGVSKEYMEAAFIDGAGHFRVLFKIMLPMALPSIMAIVITGFVGSWNDYLTPLLYLNKMYTLSSGLWMYEKRMQYIANQPVYFAGVVISLIPILVLFIVFQNTIMEKVHIGGLKG